MYLRCGTLLLLLNALNRVKLCDGDIQAAEDNKDEENSLKQAIFLVKLLRKEYGKVVRENEELRAALATTTRPEHQTQVTCPMQGDAEVNGTASPKEVQQEQRSLYSRRRSFKQARRLRKSHKEQPKHSKSNHALNKRTGQHRRNMLQDANYTVKPALREDTTTPPSTTTVAEASKGATGNSTKDPVMQQVASQLLHELKADNLGNKTTVSPKKATKNKKISIRMPTTLRIHLQRSTRYQIPFPENHAFCYTNPNNPLCRTQI